MEGRWGFWKVEEGGSEEGGWNLELERRQNQNGRWRRLRRECYWEFPITETEMYMKTRGFTGIGIVPCHQLTLPSFLGFLDASSYLYNRVCPSVGRSVRPSVRPSVRGSRFRQKRENRCGYIIIQSFHHHEDASLALWALL